MQSSNIPTKFNIPFAKNAGGAYIRTIPQNSQISVTPGAASLNDGFPPLTFTPISSGGVPPSGADFNGIMNAVTQWIQWMNAGAPVYYDATFSTAIGGYPKGALVTAAVGGFWYLSTAENNTTNPNTGGANWLQVVPASPSNLAPVSDGTAAIGTSLLFARADHVHPSDASRASLSYVNSTFLTIANAAATYLTINNPSSTGTRNHVGADNVQGDITAYRPASPTTGVIFLGNSGAKYLYFDGTSYIMPGADLVVNGTAVRAGVLAAQSSAQTGINNAAAAQSTANTALSNANAAQTAANTVTVQAIGNTFLSGGYVDVTSARSFNTVYTNNFGRVILVIVEVLTTNSVQIGTCYVNGVRVGNLSTSVNNSRGTCSFIVPIGYTYNVNTPGFLTLTSWCELH